LERRYITIAEVEEIHRRVLLHAGGLPGMRDRGALEAAVFRPQTGYYADLIEEAAALMESLTNNHAFVDGNKRTAFVATDTFLKANGLRISCTDEEAEQFFLSHLRKGTFRFPQIRDWLRKVATSRPTKKP
jgi:death-on-curing protein